MRKSFYQKNRRIFYGTRKHQFYKYGRNLAGSPEPDSGEEGDSSRHREVDMCKSINGLAGTLKGAYGINFFN